MEIPPCSKRIYVKQNWWMLDGYVWWLEGIQIGLQVFDGMFCSVCLTIYVAVSSIWAKNENPPRLIYFVRGVQRPFLTLWVTFVMCAWNFPFVCLWGHLGIAFHHKPCLELGYAEASGNGSSYQGTWSGRFKMMEPKRWLPGLNVV